MAYSFIAITKKEPDWKSLHNQVFNADSAIEMFPIKIDEKKEYGLGICIPFSKLDKYPDTWNTLVEVIGILKREYDFKVFDLYHGFYVDENNLEEVKKSLLG